MKLAHRVGLIGDFVDLGASAARAAQTMRPPPAHGVLLFEVARAPLAAVAFFASTSHRFSRRFSRRRARSLFVRTVRQLSQRANDMPFSLNEQLLPQSRQRAASLRATLMRFLLRCSMSWHGTHVAKCGRARRFRHRVHMPVARSLRRRAFSRQPSLQYGGGRVGRCVSCSNTSSQKWHLIRSFTVIPVGFSTRRGSRAWTRRGDRLRHRRRAGARGFRRRPP